MRIDLGNVDQCQCGIDVSQSSLACLLNECGAVERNNECVGWWRQSDERKDELSGKSGVPVLSSADATIQNALFGLAVML